MPKDPGAECRDPQLEKPNRRRPQQDHQRKSLTEIFSSLGHTRN